MSAKYYLPILIATVCLAVGCGNDSPDVGSGGSAGGGYAGSGGVPIAPDAQDVAFTLTCRIVELTLQLSIDLTISPGVAFTQNGSAEVMLAAGMTIDERTVSELLGSDVTDIDVTSGTVGVAVLGAGPERVDTSLVDAPINDFELAVDTDDNGVLGPHRFEFETVVATTTVAPGASEVEFRLDFAGISIVLGDVSIPDDCLSPSLVGQSARFPVR